MTIAAAIVGSRLDYCNSSYLLAHTVSNLKLAIQLVQNTLARVVTDKISFLPHHTRSPSELHLLIVQQMLIRINFKIAYYRTDGRFSSIQQPVLNSLRPSFNTVLLPTRSMRSSR